MRDSLLRFWDWLTDRNSGVGAGFIWILIVALAAMVFLPPLAAAFRWWLALWLGDPDA